MANLDFTGVTVYYEDSLKFKTVFNSVFPKPRIALEDYLVYDGQTMYDLAVQLYGSSEEGLLNVIPVLNDINNGVIQTGSLIKRTVPISNIGKQFNNNDVLVATGVSVLGVPTEGGFDYSFDFIFGSAVPITSDGLESGLEFGLVG